MSDIVTGSTAMALELTALRAENERLTEELSIWMSVFPDIAPQSVLPDRSKLEADNERLRAALEKMQRSRDRYRQAWEAEKARARAALEEK